MTIADVGKYDYSDEEKYSCRWFDAKHTVMQMVFGEEELEHAVRAGDILRLERG
jgi:uncharacterized protein YodC (DUF2158 family)